MLGILYPYFPQQYRHFGNLLPMKYLNMCGSMSELTLTGKKKLSNIFNEYTKCGNPISMQQRWLWLAINGYLWLILSSCNRVYFSPIRIRVAAAEPTPFFFLLAAIYMQNFMYR